MTVSLAQPSPETTRLPASADTPFDNHTKLILKFNKITYKFEVSPKIDAQSRFILVRDVNEVVPCLPDNPSGIYLLRLGLSVVRFTVLHLVQFTVK